jgi:hypothetical protein
VERREDSPWKYLQQHHFSPGWQHEQAKGTAFGSTRVVMMKLELAQLTSNDGSALPVVCMCVQ